MERIWRDEDDRAVCYRTADREWRGYLRVGESDGETRRIPVTAASRVGWIEAAGEVAREHEEEPPTGFSSEIQYAGDGFRISRRRREWRLEEKARSDDFAARRIASWSFSDRPFETLRDAKSAAETYAGSETRAAEVGRSTPARRDVEQTSLFDEPGA